MNKFREKILKCFRALYLRMGCFLHRSTVVAVVVGAVALYGQSSQFFSLDCASSSTSHDVIQPITVWTQSASFKASKIAL